MPYFNLACGVSTGLVYCPYLHFSAELATAVRLSYVFTGSAPSTILYKYKSYTFLKKNQTNCTDIAQSPNVHVSEAAQ